MKNIHTFLIIFLAASFSISCQSSKRIAEPAIKDDHLVKGDFSIIKTDKLGFIYLVSEDNEILKYDSKLNLTYKFSVNTLGEISSIDISNPQKVLVYYPDYQNIVFLDTTLSEIERLNLENLNFWDIQGVALSTDNLIWIYDPINYRLIKIDYSGNVIISSNESFFGEGEEALNQKIYALENHVYLYSDNELLVFDIFGQKLQTIKINNQTIQFIRKQYAVLNNNEIKLGNLNISFIEKKESTLYAAQDRNIKDFSLLDNVLYLIDEGGLFKIDLGK